MDLLKRSLAPITDKAWEEIDQRAREVLRSHLSARKVVDVTGPKGWELAAVGLGELTIPENQDANEVNFGVHNVLPLIETRIRFQLDIMELDRANRGATDIDLQPLEQAARKAAAFEEKVVYHGFKPGYITGIFQSVGNDVVEFDPGQPASFLEGLTEGMEALRRAGVSGPLKLVINPGVWQDLMERTHGYPLTKHVRQLVEEGIVPSTSIEGALLVSTRGGDSELILGQDFSVGYYTHDAQKVTLYVTESFTFRVNEPQAMVQLRGRSAMENH